MIILTFFQGYLFELSFSNRFAGESQRDTAVNMIRAIYEPFEVICIQAFMLFLCQAVHGFARFCTRDHPSIFCHLNRFGSQGHLSVPKYSITVATAIHLSISLSTLPLLVDPLGAAAHSWPEVSTPSFSGWGPETQTWRYWFSQLLYTWLQTDLSRAGGYHLIRSEERQRAEMLYWKKWKPSITWRYLEIVYIKVINRISDKGQYSGFTKWASHPILPEQPP